MLGKLNLTSFIVCTLLFLFGINIFLLVALIEKHNDFTEQHHTVTLVKPQSKYKLNTRSEGKQHFVVSNSTDNIKSTSNDVTSLLWSDMTKSQQIEVK